MLVTGPTGSGKSTTLYAALAALNSIEKKVITIEDPVEYQIHGVNQINVNPKAGLDFASGLRSILRADPDVIMVGEIRDAETARIAIEAALTGHLVLSTLHTNDAPGTITRLSKMGIESFLTASAVDCIVAQRLARTLCPSCKRRAPWSRRPRWARPASAPRRDRGLRVGRLRPLRQHRLPRPGRPLLGDADDRADQRHDGQRSRRRPTSPRSRDQEGMLTLREDGLAKAAPG